jgi:uncharacterized protein YlxP (DUF503 family)
MTSDRSTMWVGWLEADLLLGDVHSLKQKRSVVRPLVHELRRALDVSVAEVGHVDLYRRAVVGVGLVSGDHGHAEAVLERAERLLASRPEVELLSVRRRLVRADDLD